MTYDNIVLTEVIAEVWEHDEMTTTKFDMARGTIRQVLNKPA